MIPSKNLNAAFFWPTSLGPVKRYAGAILFLINLYSKGENISVVNLAMPEQSGKSSTLSFSLDYYYKNMPDFNYRIYANTELGLYWTKGY